MNIATKQLVIDSLLPQLQAQKQGLRLFPLLNSYTTGQFEATLFLQVPFFEADDVIALLSDFLQTPFRPLIKYLPDIDSVQMFFSKVPIYGFYEEAAIFYSIRIIATDIVRTSNQIKVALKTKCKCNNPKCRGSSAHSPSKYVEWRPAYTQDNIILNDEFCMSYYTYLMICEFGKKVSFDPNGIFYIHNKDYDKKPDEAWIKNIMNVANYVNDVIRSKPHSPDSPDYDTYYNNCLALNERFKKS